MCAADCNVDDFRYYVWSPIVKDWQPCSFTCYWQMLSRAVFDLYLHEGWKFATTDLRSQPVS